MKTIIRKFSVFPHSDNTTAVVVWRRTPDDSETTTRRYENVTQSTCTRLEELSFYSDVRTRAHIGQGWAAIFIHRNY